MRAPLESKVTRSDRPEDLVRDRPEDYATPEGPAWIRATHGKVVAVDGVGAPGGPEFQESLQHLYGVVYTLKFQQKRAGEDFRIPPLEGLWWLGGSASATSSARWRLQIPVPGSVDRTRVKKAVSELESRRKVRLGSTVRLLAEKGGRAVQMLHLGPYSEEAGNLERIESFARAGGYAPQPWHVEVYLSDPRRVPPARLRTILRRPVRPQRGTATRTSS